MRYKNLIWSLKNLGLHIKGEEERKKRRKKKKKKKEKSKKGMDFWVFVWNHVYFGFLGFLVWIIRPLYGFPWFLGF